MNFNFNNLSESNFNSTSRNYLKPYDIYEVKLTKLEKGTIQGKKDSTASYDVVNIEFEGEDGIFQTNLFYPHSDKDVERTENETNHKAQPSNFERFQFTLMQIVQVLNPKGAESIKNVGSKIKTIDDFVNLVSKAVADKKNIQVFLKLIGRNNGGVTYATLPSSCYVNADGKCMPLPFISLEKNGLNFSAYEVGKRNEYLSAKPTNMSNVEKNDSEDIDLSNIEL